LDLTANRVVSPKEFAGLLSISKDTLYRLIAAGRIPRPTQIPGSRRVGFPAQVVGAALEQFNEAAAAAQNESPR
jgi:excisionase family DNA binding protein